jgi:hypothetical protein
MENKYTSGSDEFREELYKSYNDQLLLLERLYKYQFEELDHLDDTRLGSLYLLLFSMTYTGSSISYLAEGMRAENCFINECYMLARSLIERIINYLYLLYCEEEEYKSYLQYTKQKGFRVLNRSFTVGDSEVALKTSESINLEGYPEIAEAVERFTSKKGKTITRWTKSSISDMLETIKTKGNIDIRYLMLAVLDIYDDASEALHGTIYGATFHIGHYYGKLPKSKEELKESINRQLSSLFLMLSTSIHTLITGFNDNVAIGEIYNKSIPRPQ